MKRKLTYAEYSAPVNKEFKKDVEIYKESRSKYKYLESSSNNENLSETIREACREKMQIITDVNHYISENYDINQAAAVELYLDGMDEEAIKILTGYSKKSASYLARHILYETIGKLYYDR